MVLFVRSIRLHKRPMILARLLCLTLMLVLFANPVLAVVSTSMGCSGQGCCCTNNGPEPTVKISANTDKNSACCSPRASIPCRVTTNSLPVAPPALTQATQRGTADTIHLLPSGFIAAMSDQSHRLSISIHDTGSTIPAPPLYLQSCRLIC